MSRDGLTVGFRVDDADGAAIDLRNRMTGQSAMRPRDLAGTTVRGRMLPELTTIADESTYFVDPPPVDPDIPF